MTKESRGWHLNFASPEGLQRDGRVELGKRHGSLNASKYCLLDRFAVEGGFSEGTGEANPDNAAQCMKYGVPYKVSQLLAMPPLEKRGIPDAPDRAVMVVDASRGLVEFVDAHGHRTLVPERPGDMACITALPPDHPCVEFVRQRGFTPAELKNYCRATYCDRELEADPDKGRYYGWLPGGFRATPQGRLILHCDINGVPRGWQARILEKDVGPVRMAWHPYENRWVHVTTKDAVSGKHVPIPSMMDNDGKFEPQKYKNAFGSKRNELLIGYDAANIRNLVHNRSGPKTAVIVEGPLTGAAVRGPGIAVLGKHMSEQQARLIANRFDRVILVPDADDVGQGAVSKWMSALAPHIGEVSVVQLPREFISARSSCRHKDRRRIFRIGDEAHQLRQTQTMDEQRSYRPKTVGYDSGVITGLRTHADILKFLESLASSKTELARLQRAHRKLEKQLPDAAHITSIRGVFLGPAFELHLQVIKP